MKNKALKAAKTEKYPVDLSVMTGWAETAKRMSQKAHWNYFVIDQFLRGNHAIRGNPSENTIEIARSNNTVSFPINKIYSTFRSVRGFVTRHQPVVQVEPENSSDKAKDYARRANKILERDNQLNNYRKINKEWVYYGVKYGVGYRQVGYDKEKKCCIRWSVDPWDLWIGSTDGEMEDAPYVVKTVKRTMGYLWEKYPSYKDKLTSDNELAADPYKKMSLEIVYRNEGDNTSLRKEDETAIVYECWYRVYEENKAGGRVNKCTFTDGCVLDHEETPYDDYPFIPYKSDIVPNEASGEGHLKHVIAPQRLLDMLNMQIIEYNHIINKGRFITEKNSGFDVVNTKQGQVIRVNTGRRLEAAPVPPLNPIIQWHTEKAEDWIQDLGGQNDASTGRLPSASLSGDAIEALQVGDSNNISDLRDNFEDALALEAQWILKLYSMFEDEGFVTSNKINDEEEETFGAVGQLAYEKSGKKLPNQDGRDMYYDEDNGDYCEVCTILPDNQVKVTVTSQLGETKAARTEMLFRLLEAGVPLKTVLEFLEFPNVSDMMERIASEGVAETMMQGMGAQMAQPPQPMPGGEAVPMPEIDALEGEIGGMGGQ